MFKKLTMLAMAVGALLAFAIPAVASANVTLTDEEGSPVVVGTEITATSTNTTTVTANGSLTCPKVIIHGELTSNGSDVAIKSLGTTTEGQCKFLGAVNTTITSPAVGNITLSTGGSGTIASTTFISDIAAPVNLTCHFSSSSLGISWTSTGVSVSNGVLAGTGTGCPTEGKISGTFSLEANGEALTID